MKITNDTTTYEVAELMGSEADELDGRIMMGLLSRECVVDTDDLSEDQWLALIDESQKVMRYYLSEDIKEGYRPAPYTVQFALECLANDPPSA
ncbi:hypothetical protein IPC730_30565 [Pseudomonas aeruginosa]|nr:hypothetical protein IPC730_30565 [Pseudomonas aeruginosa]